MLFFCYTPEGNLFMLSERSAVAGAKAWPSYIYFVSELAPIEEGVWKR